MFLGGAAVFALASFAYIRSELINDELVQEALDIVKGTAIIDQLCDDPDELKIGWLFMGSVDRRAGLANVTLTLKGPLGKAEVVMRSEVNTDIVPLGQDPSAAAQDIKNWKFLELAVDCPDRNMRYSYRNTSQAFIVEDSQGAQLADMKSRAIKYGLLLCIPGGVAAFFLRRSQRPQNKLVRALLAHPELKDRLGGRVSVVSQPHGLMSKEFLNVNLTMKGSSARARVRVEAFFDASKRQWRVTKSVMQVQGSSRKVALGDVKL